MRKLTLHKTVTPEYDAIKYVHRYYNDNDIEKMSWQDFQKKFQAIAQRYAELLREIRQNKPFISEEMLLDWLKNYKSDTGYEVEESTFYNPEYSYRDVEQKVIQLNRGAEVDSIIKEDSLLDRFLDMLYQAAQSSGHPVGRKTVGFFRIDKLTEDYLLIDEVQTDLFTALSTARRFVTSETYEDLMSHYTHPKLREEIDRRGFNEYAFESRKNEFLSAGYTPAVIDALQKKCMDLFKNWLEVGISTIIEIARKAGVRNILLNTAENIGDRDPTIEVDKLNRYYKQVAKRFGFKERTFNEGNVKGTFFHRTAQKV